jgi:HEAT repeat protein
MRDEAALALGSSRLPAAVDILKETLEKTREVAFRAVLFRALSLSRDTAALDLLLGILKTARAHEALDALEALSIHRATPEIRHQVESALAGRPAELQTQFRRLFC